jgi:hypothetical protein
MLTTDSVSVIKKKSNIRFGLIRISYNLLASLLRLPQSFEIVSVEDDIRYNGITIKFTHPNIKETLEGGEIPVVQPGQMDWNI